MNYWEIGYLIFTCLTWFLLFGFVVKAGQGAPSWVKIIALISAVPFALVWPLTLLLSSMAGLAKAKA